MDGCVPARVRGVGSARGWHGGGECYSKGGQHKGQGKNKLSPEKGRKTSPFLFRRPTWTVNEAFSRKVGQAPLEIRHSLPLSDLLSRAGRQRDQCGLRDLHTPSGSFQGGFGDLWGHAQSQPCCREQQRVRRPQSSGRMND